jgi:DnaJ-class molecular chaperone
VKAWHPDKFHTKAPSLKKEAEEEMKRIIRAFDLLEKKLKNTGKK